MKREEMMTVRAQMAGMDAGASADVYNELFADTAVRRKDNGNRRGQVSMALASSQMDRKKTSCQNVSKAVQQALRDCREVRKPLRAW